VKRPTIADIARRAGVSKGAVSYALNGRPGVSELTRARILAVADELGWSPNSAARALSAARAEAVGMVVARPARTLGLEPFFIQLISGIEAELAKRSVALVLQFVTDIEAEADVLRRWWGQRRIDGVIVVDLRVDDVRVRVLEELKLPAVVIGGPEGLGTLVGVWSDDAAAIRSVVEYLVALGHRRLARVTGLPELRHTAIRTEAYLDAARALKVQAAVRVADYTGEEGARATRTLLSARQRPTAIVYDNDVMAVAGVAVAQEMGLSVPGDVSIVAWDDSSLCQLVHPPLTALSRDIPAYGAHAAERLLQLIDRLPVTTFQDATAQLVPRGSTGPAPASRLRSIR
jgi:DNA-binding LacI/PurR family transcriptional regulator